MATTFDTLKAAQDLKAAGFNDEQSKAIVLAIQASLEGISASIITKADLAELRADIVATAIFAV